MRNYPGIWALCMHPSLWLSLAAFFELCIPRRRNKPFMDWLWRLQRCIDCLAPHVKLMAMCNCQQLSRV